MERTHYQASNCSIARTLQVVGEKWTLLIIRESFYGATRFEQFHRVLQCARNLLSERLTVLVDDYAEVWVNGQIPRQSGYPSPATIQGLNMPNRVVLANAVKPGDKFQIAVFGINGPISVAPANTVWFREARLQFYK